ncbi:iron-sulfur cluster repair di-iron protein [Daejeonella lutea]|uniref:Regulator of cell morphogenesis and NO signaling n=1 Tax=Daejeonella lutea TaxID=572036 RepID=A0A1T5A4K1_9SPHI|nr:iron-sulfur cluster repair di-iron protein [Daejeonella lutea]SKB29876.1 regulator of cell morphogenesis and NO signaling [Daejeonella lutea]
MEILDILDVTQIEPRFKHPRIFEKFDSLNPNEGFIIDNDHDPKPLYYQLIGERGNVFTWDYLENGPERWKVKIRKIDGQDKVETIGEMVTKDYRKAQVFKKFGIDFCCGGKKTVEEVCLTKGLDSAKIISELEAVQNQEPAAGHKFDEWPLDFLADYIINTHHDYVKNNVPFITELANKVAKVHRQGHPETIEIANIFNEVGKDLSLHLMKEENIVFPYVKALVQNTKTGEASPIAAFDSIETPTQMMEMEHEQAGEAMAAIRELTADYTLPEGACTSYTLLYKKLQEFENDLFNHVHLENNILFPKAIALEKESLGSEVKK